MVEFLLTSTVHKRAEDLCSFLLSPEQVSTVLPGHLFRNVAKTDAMSLEMEYLFLGHWWKTRGQLERVPVEAPGTAQPASSPGALAVIWRAVSPLPLEVEWRMTPLKRDRRGERVTLRLRLRLELPGGALGRVVERLLVERPLLSCWDAVLRAVVTALEGVPRSGIKGEG